MFYLVKKNKVNHPHTLARLAGVETYHDNIVSDVVRVDCWKAVTRRVPNQPWKHMKELYGTLQGKTAFLCGSGPSLKEMPEKANHPVFAVNRSIRHIKADYWCLTDLDAYESSKDHPHAKAAMLVCNIQLYEKLNGVPCYMIENAGDPWRWKEGERPLYYNETTTGWAIHLAMRMGVDRLVMIGNDGPGGGMFDGHIQDGRDRNWQLDQHYGVMERMLQMFHPDEREKWNDRPMEIIDASGGYLPVKKGRLRDYL